tara:strand:- start:318 stop:455 length:138 start_codon:yes stop_codon:yes gene_type:complete
MNKDGTVKLTQDPNQKHKSLDDLIKENEIFKRKVLKKKALEKNKS